MWQLDKNSRPASPAAVPGTALQLVGPVKTRFSRRMFGRFVEPPEHHCRVFVAAAENEAEGDGGRSAQAEAGREGAGPEEEKEESTVYNNVDAEKGAESSRVCSRARPRIRQPPQ